MCLLVIADPIYDVVFKWLLENERVAKFFIGTLPEETVESVTLLSQAYTYQLANTVIEAKEDVLKEPNRQLTGQARMTEKSRRKRGDGG